MTYVTTPVLAAVHYSQGFDVSAIISEAIDRLRKRGLAVGGLMQEAERAGPGQCAMLNVVDPRSGRRARITQNRGKESRGCKLDEQGLIALSHCVDSAIADRVDVVVISRFGRAEAAGDGLLTCFTNAVCAGVPLLTAVREPYVERWREFHGGLGIELPPSSDVIVDWIGSMVHSAEADRRLDSALVD